MFIDDLRDFRILVGLTVHYMAPVAPHRANVQQDGLVLPLGLFKRLRTPFMPVDGLVHGGAQVRRRSAGEGIKLLGAHRNSV